MMGLKRCLTYDGRRSPRCSLLGDDKLERLVKEVVRMTGENETEAIHKGLKARRARLLPGLPAHERREQLLRFLEGAVWSLVPPEERGRRLTRAEEEAILGFGPDGV
jgi:antitoxin VapB